MFLILWFSRVWSLDAVRRLRCQGLLRGIFQVLSWKGRIRLLVRDHLSRRLLRKIWCRSQQIDGQSVIGLLLFLRTAPQISINAVCSSPFSKIEQAALQSSRALYLRRLDWAGQSIHGYFDSTWKLGYRSLAFQSLIKTKTCFQISRRRSLKALPGRAHDHDLTHQLMPGSRK